MSNTTKKTNIEMGEIFANAMNWVDKGFTGIQNFIKTQTEKYGNKSEDGYIYCDNCGNRCVNTNIVLTSLPAQYKYVCPVCGKEVTSFRNVFHPDDEDLYKRWKSGEFISTVNEDNSTNGEQDGTAVEDGSERQSVNNATLPLTNEEQERIKELYEAIKNLTEVDKKIEFVKDNLLCDFLPSTTIEEVLNILSKQQELYLKQIMPADLIDEH